MWTWKHRFALAFCAAFLTVQTVVPLLRLARPRPARFGWQMWTVRPTFPTFRMVMADGTKRAPDLSVYVAVNRGEVDLRDALPPHLCRAVPGVTAVEITEPVTDLVSVQQCH
jgi:hypothetical protein